METVSVIRQSRMKTKISMDMNEHKNVEIEKKTHTQTTRGATEWQLGMVLVHGANKYMHVAWQEKMFVYRLSDLHTPSLSKLSLLRYNSMVGFLLLNASFVVVSLLLLLLLLAKCLFGSFTFMVIFVCCKLHYRSSSPSSTLCAFFQLCVSYYYQI